MKRRPRGWRDGGPGAGTRHAGGRWMRRGPETGSLRSGAGARRSRRPGVRLRIALGLLGLGTAAVLPAAAGGRGEPDEESRTIGIAQECVWGERVLAEVLRQWPESPDEALQRRFRRVGHRVARVSDRPDHLYHFLVVQRDEPQAFSAPCGFIWASEGLMRIVGDDELAFAIGHEIAHTIQRHQVRQLQIDRLLDRKRAPRSLFDYTHSMLKLESELEADRFGALYAMRADYRFSAGLDLLARLQEAIQGPKARQARTESELRQEALRDFREELELTMTRFDEATTAIREGRPDEAIANLSLFVAQFPNSVVGRVNLAAAYLLKVRREAGAPSGLAEEFPMLPEPWPALRGALSRLDLERALENFQRALAIQPDPTAEDGLGLIYTRYGDFDSAREHLERARAGSPGNVQVLLARGNVEYLAGEYREALFYYVEALRLQPGWSPAMRNLEMTYAKLKDQGESDATPDGPPGTRSPEGG